MVTALFLIFDAVTVEFLIFGPVTALFLIFDVTTELFLIFTAVTFGFRSAPSTLPTLKVFGSLRMRLGGDGERYQ